MFACPRCGDLCDQSSPLCSGCGARIFPTRAELQLAATVNRNATGGLGSNLVGCSAEASQGG